MRLTLTSLLTATALVACSSQADSAPAADATPFSLELVEIAEGLEFPWGMAFLPSGDMLVTERDGRLRIIRDGTLDPEPVAGAPQDAYVSNQGGYLDVILHPDFADNRLIYMSYAQGTQEDNRTAVIRARLSEDAGALENVEEIFASDVPGKRGGAHFGARLQFLNDGTLLVTLGDGFRWMDEAQDPANHFGKIVRLTEDGAPAPGNPDLGEGADPAVYTYGHRNVQGIAYDGARGIIYAHEHGPKGGDELNIIRPGTNYGWPEITYGVNYDGTIITPQTEAEGMAQPEMKWVPSIAPSGMELYSGDVYPGWQGDLFIGAMNGPAGQKLVRVDLDEAGQVTGREDLLADEAIPFRDVVQGPDGKLYLATAELDGRIFRLDIAQ
ncbi:MAG: PQQ-dependent sugar dehydrogenase [Alphaproteobacteria bacterium]|jgi:glucose/arabinose dehydrogenase|nr:PQQ-dependent sugar dehydrogenase [Alphaproteobacteria bacterium]